MTQPDIFDDEAPWAEWLPELRTLLEAYASVPREERFTDTDEVPSKAMRTYLRMATYYPGRAYRATHEILDVLKYGLDEADVASNLASMPPIVPPPGRDREECLTAMLPHLAAFTEDHERAEPAFPETAWECRERLPNLAQLLGAYFHQDAGADDEAILDGYVAHERDYRIAAAAREIRELRALGEDEEDPEAAVRRAVRLLGAGVLPGSGGLPGDGVPGDGVLPDAGPVTAWLDRIAARLDAHLAEAGHEPPAGRDPAYPAHDIRSVVG
jgi:hypothetical protein